MMDLATVACTPVGIETTPTFVVASESSCPSGWSGQYISPSQSYRRIHFVWTAISAAAAASFRALLVDTSNGAGQVVFTPPTDPAGAELGTPIVSQQETVVGRLRGPFGIRQSGFNEYRIDATLEEDH